MDFDKFFGYIGDAFTKIGGGVFGGTVVAFYYSEFINLVDVDRALYTYLTTTGLTIMFLGYVIRYLTEK